MSKGLCPTLVREIEKEGLICKGSRPKGLSFWVRIEFLTYILGSLVDSFEMFLPIKLVSELQIARLGYSWASEFFSELAQ